MYQVRKAVIPAAGLGTRFLPATKAQPKEMLPIVDKPTIQYVVEEAAHAGLTDILIITGRGKRAVEDHFDKAFELEYFLKKKKENERLKQVEESTRIANIHFIRQKEPLGLGHAVLCAKDHVGGEPFVVLLGDNIVELERPCTAELIDQYYLRKCSILALQPVPEEKISSYGIIEGHEVEDGIYRITDMIEKPDASDAPSDLAILGRYLLTPAIFPCIEQTKADKRGEIQLTDAIKILGKTEEIYGIVYKGKRWDIGDVNGFLRATVDLALERDDLRASFMEYLRSLMADEGGKR
jgi:UTP--glucose-1-phosphate uridylyltransferase